MSNNAPGKAAHNQPDYYAPLGRTLPIAEKLQGLLLRRARTGILQLLKTRQAHTVLDVCCGPGCLSCRLTMAGLYVTGVDSSPTMINRVKEKRRAANVELCDASKIPFSNEFDAAVISLALHEMDESTRVSVWNAMRRAVKPGGLLVALDFTLPKVTSMRSQIMRRLIDQDEKGIGGINPSHYLNYREFMGGGGMEAWLNSREPGAMTASYYAGGTLGVFAVPA